MFLHLLMFFNLLFFLHLFPGYFNMSLALYPSFLRPWRPPLALSSTSTTFDCLFYFIHCERYGFEWAFFTQIFFTLCSFPRFFGTICFYQGSPGSRQLFFEVCRASLWSLKNRPGQCVCFIHSNPHSFIHRKFVFMHINIAKVLLVVKTLIKK